MLQTLRGFKCLFLAVNFVYILSSFFNQLKSLNGLAAAVYTPMFASLGQRNRLLIWL